MSSAPAKAAEAGAGKTRADEAGAEKTGTGATKVAEKGGQVGGAGSACELPVTFAVATPDGPVVVHLGGMDTEEHTAMLPAFELAKKTLKPRR
ncbi:lipoprotein [Streptomyces anulatus]|uniref:lipoprotein n=1 Tax=Streptomyces anulatus TaxID=1892 RepID=UPI003647D0FC